MKPKKTKRIPIGKLKAKADRAMQDYFRRKLTKCELCPNPYQVAHHFIHKSQSNYLRYDVKNLIFICNSCHSKFHSFPDPLIGIRVAKLRDSTWVHYIETHKRLLKKDDRKELEEIISLYGPKTNS